MNGEVVTISFDQVISTVSKSHSRLARAGESLKASVSEPCFHSTQSFIATRMAFSWFKSKKAATNIIDKVPNDGIALKACAIGNAKFGHALHQVLVQAEPGKNLAHSPVSLSTVLAMVKFGARNQTSQELERACHFPKEDSQLGAGYKTLLKMLQGTGSESSCELATANRLYIQKGFKIEPLFSSAIQEHFMAGELQKVDFSKSNAAAEEINGWVAKVTKDKIKNLLSPEALNGLTRLVLVNGIYFKGIWASSFEAHKTKLSAFQKCNGSANVTQVNMMNMVAKLAYAEIANSQVVELPYKGGELSMLVFLPKKVDGLHKFQQEFIDHGSLFTKMKPETVILSLPKFRIESSHQLVPRLKEMGLGILCSPDKADFSGISDEGLFVTEAVQKVFVEVNEEGTEAAAATAVVLGLRSRGATQPKVQMITFNADHPFMFQIIHKRSHLVLFTGCVLDPNQT